MTEGNVNEGGIMPNCKCCKKKQKRQENTNNKIDIWCTIYRSIYFREFSNERTRVERRETFRKLRMRENFSKVDLLKYSWRYMCWNFSKVDVFFLQYVRKFSRAPFYECEGWISWSGSTGFHLRISTTLFTGFWGLLSVDQQSGWVEYSQFLFKGPSLLNSKVQNSTCCKTDPQHTSNLSREPREYPCKLFLAGVNFYRFNAKN